jgi:hypothetical protein
MSKRATPFDITDPRITKRWCTNDVYKLKEELGTAWVYASDTDSDYWYDLYEDAKKLVEREDEMKRVEETGSARRALSRAKILQEERLAIRAKKEEEKNALHEREVMEAIEAMSL